MGRRPATPGFDLFIGQLFDLYDSLSRTAPDGPSRALRSARVAVRQIDAYTPGDEVEAFHLEVAREMLTELIRDLGGRV